MSEAFNLTYKEQSFLIHIIGRIGADLQVKEGWSELKVKQTLDFALIPSNFYGAYCAWTDEYKDDVSRIVNGEKPNQPLSIMHRAYDNAYRLVEQRLENLRAYGDQQSPAMNANPPSPAPSALNWPYLLLGMGIGIGASATLYWLTQ